MIRKIHYFNMIEVLLALAVIAIGMTTILGLFPVGLKASRQAVAENSSANVADQMVTYMRVMGETSPPLPADPAINYNATFTDATTALPEYSGLNLSGNTTIDIRENASGTISFNIDDESKKFLDEYKLGEINEPGDIIYEFSRVAQGWSVFVPVMRPSTPYSLRRRVYFIVQGPSSAVMNNVNRVIDYSAMALVWKDTVQIKRLESGGTVWSNWPSDAIMTSGTILEKYQYSGKINIELSWPLIMPYKDRKKRYYQVVINKPN